jgi:hypothetical protein
MTRRAGDERTASYARLGEGGANPFDGPGLRIGADHNMRGDRGWTKLTGIVENAGKAGRSGIWKPRARMAGAQQTLTTDERT